MKKKGTIRKKDKMPAGRDGSWRDPAKQKLQPTHRKKGVKSKPVGTRSMLTRAETGGGY